MAAGVTAYRRGLVGLVRRDRSSSETAPKFVQTDEFPDNPAPSPSETDAVFAELAAALGNGKAVQAALLMAQDYNLNEIGEKLGVRKSQAHNLVQEGLKRLGEYPGIKELLEPGEPGEPET